MPIFYKFVRSIALFGFLFLGLHEIRAETSSLSISYGIDGKPPYYTYRLVEDRNHHITCELEGAGKIISRKDFVWRSDLQILWKEIVNDFAQTEPEAINWVPDNPVKKRVSISNGSDKLERQIVIIGTDANLSNCFNKAPTIHEFFASVSRGENLDCRLVSLEDSPKLMDRGPASTDSARSGAKK